ncbi:MAG: 2-C-methyl-D-erythritol 4-phosphate cytidylyltransferase [Candidatus Goldbacteria bacterium]|nr:2-C-methyl-D-erythritol 4-phosphate cytidylyltransferase [Candidatus Goldiibacteriota bacterium]
MVNIGIIMGAGSGRRFGHRLPKQYHKIKNKEIIAYSGLIFERTSCIDGILFVVEKKFIEFVKKNIVKKYGFKKVLDIISGGKERFHSVYNAIEYLNKIKPENILIHDGVRPFVSKGLIENIVKLLDKQQAVIPLVNIHATLKMVRNGYVIKTLDRQNVKLAATPQGFKYEILKKLYNEDYINKIKPTDESYVFEKAGLKVKYIEEDERNIKITTKNDIEIIKLFLNREEI